LIILSSEKEKKMKRIVVSIALATALTGVTAQASVRNVVVAQCEFQGKNLSKSQTSCVALASACIDDAGAMQLACEPRLLIDCDRVNVFYDNWTPGYVSNPVTLIIQGQSSAPGNSAKLSITPGGSHDTNPALLELGGNAMSGNCHLTFDSLSVFVNSPHAGDSFR